MQMLGLTVRIFAMSIERKIAENLELLNGRGVAFDIDAVTQATYVLALRGVSERFGRVVSKEELVDYWYLAKIAMQHGIPQAESLEFARGAWNRHDVYLNSPPMPGIGTVLEVFAKAGVFPKFISSRPEEFLDTSREWFKNTFPGMVKPEDIILGRKEGMSGGQFKSDMAKKYGIGLFVEDAPEEAIAIAESGVRVLIVPQPWNIQQKIDHPNVKHLGEYLDSMDGSWPILRFLLSQEAKSFLASVAQ